MTYIVSIGELNFTHSLSSSRLLLQATTVLIHVFEENQLKIENVTHWLNSSRDTNAF